MKRFTQHILAYLAVALFALGAPILAGTTDSVAVSKEEFPGVVRYYGTATFADSASGAIYITQAMRTAGMTANYAFATFVCSEAGTEDVNVFVEYSNDLLTWVAGTTDSDLDAVGTTAVEDTIGIVGAVVSKKFRAYPYMRYKFVAGQNMNSTTISWSTVFTKPTGLEMFDLGKILDTEA